MVHVKGHCHKWECCGDCDSLWPRAPEQNDELFKIQENQALWLTFPLRQAFYPPAKRSWVKKYHNFLQCSFLCLKCLQINKGKVTIFFSLYHIQFQKFWNRTHHGKSSNFILLIDTRQILQSEINMSSHLNRTSHYIEPGCQDWIACIIFFKRINASK